MFDPSARLYMRFRGKTTGPFSLAQIEQMRQLGRVTAFHEVSIDGVQWVLAADAGLVTSAGPGQNAPLGMVTQPTLLAPLAIEWYYLDAAGARLGPVSPEQMAEMIAGGKLTAKSEVWSEGFADWMPLAQTDLAGYLPQKRTTGKGTTQLIASPEMGKPGGIDFVLVGYLCCVGASFPCPLLGIPALICAIMNLSRRRVSHGLVQLFLSIVLSSVGGFLWYLVYQQIDKQGP